MSEAATFLAMSEARLATLRATRRRGTADLGAVLAFAAALAVAVPAVGSIQAPPMERHAHRNLFEEGITAAADPLLVHVAEWAVLPEAHGMPAYAQCLVDVPGADRLFVATTHGMLYAVSYDGATVSPYLNIGRLFEIPPVLFKRGGNGEFAGLAFHPQFAEAGAPGFGKFYTLLEVVDSEPDADFAPRRGVRTRFDTVLLEWTTSDPTAWVYDGGSPRSVMRIEQPFLTGNGGAIAFQPGVAPGAAGYGLLYIALGDGGGRGDPLRLVQDLNSVYGKLLRIDPLEAGSATASQAASGRYGVPADNPFAHDGRDDTLGEIYAYGLRNPNTFGWDVANGSLYVADIGGDWAEEINVVRAGDNLGWPVWEGSFRVVRDRGLWRRLTRLREWTRYFAGGRAEIEYPPPYNVVLTGKRGDPALAYPVVEYDHIDPLWPRPLTAVTGVVVCRECAVPRLDGKVIFGDLPSGEIFYFSADDLPTGGPSAIRRVLLTTDSQVDGDGDAGRRQGKTLLQLIRDKNAAEGREEARRADLRFGTSAAGDVFLLNKGDGVIRRLGPPAGR